MGLFTKIFHKNKSLDSSQLKNSSQSSQMDLPPLPPKDESDQGLPNLSPDSQINKGNKGSDLNPSLNDNNHNNLDTLKLNDGLKSTSDDFSVPQTTEPSQTEGLSHQENTPPGISNDHGFGSENKLENTNPEFQNPWAQNVSKTKPRVDSDLTSSSSASGSTTTKEEDPFAGLDDFSSSTFNDNQMEEITKKEDTPNKEDFEMRPKQEVGNDIENHYTPDGPIYVKVDDFKQFIEGQSVVKNNLKESNNIITRMNELIIEEDKQYETWRNEMENINKKLVLVEKKIF